MWEYQIRSNVHQPLQSLQKSRASRHSVIHVEGFVSPTMVWVQVFKPLTESQWEGTVKQRAIGEPWRTVNEVLNVASRLPEVS